MASQAGRSAAPSADPWTCDARRRQRAGTVQVPSVRPQNDAGSIADATSHLPCSASRSGHSSAALHVSRHNNAARDTKLVKSVALGPLVAAMNQWRTDFKAAIEKFSTPGVDQTRTLLGRAGFDPRPSWTWNQRGGRGRGLSVVEPAHVSKVIDQWLRIRHDIAHGHSTFHPLPVLTAVRDPRSSAKVRQAPNLRLDDAIDCMAFFRSIVRLTAQYAAAHIGVVPPKWASMPVLALGVNVAAL